LNIARDILGDSEEINNYQKFKRLTRAYPENKNFKRNLDVVLAKLQTAVRPKKIIYVCLLSHVKKI
jgi:hypothetical protein